MDAYPKQRAPCARRPYWRSVIAFGAIVWCGATLQHSFANEPLPSLTPATQAPPEVDFSKPERFDELRAAYAQRADFWMRCEKDKPSKPFMERITAKDFEAAAGIAHKWLAQCPVDARMHLWIMAAYRDLGRTELEMVHRTWFVGLTDSAMKGGSGKTQDDPIEVISIDEEYAVLTRLGLKRDKQALIAGKTMLDALTAKDEQGEAITLYFNPKWHFIRLAYLLGEKKK